MTTDNLEVNQEIESRRIAIDDLVAKITNEALGKLSCLSLGSKTEVEKKLRALINKTVEAKLLGGEHCTGAWDEDGTFVVTVQDHIDVGGSRISVALSLGETRIP